MCKKVLLITANLAINAKIGDKMNDYTFGLYDNSDQVLGMVPSGVIEKMNPRPKLATIDVKEEHLIKTERGYALRANSNAIITNIVPTTIGIAV